MSGNFHDLPEVDVSTFDDAFWTGELPAETARAATRVGPIFKWYPSNGPEVGRAIVTMVGPEANRFVMHTHRDHFSHDLGWTPLVGDIFGKGLLNMDDPEHAIHRKMWNPAFAAAYMGVYLPVMQRVIEERTSRWPGQDKIDLYAESREITFDIAAAALAGFRPGPEVDHLRQLFYMLLHGFDDSTESFDEFYTRMMNAQGELVGVLVNMIHARREAPAEERPRDVLSMIVHATDETGAQLSDTQVLAHLNILLVAGHETTTTLGAWALYLLTQMPDQYQRLLDEVNSVLGDSSELSMESVRSLKALDNYVKETGRLYPPVINVPRGVTREFEFNGYTVPEGTQVRLCLAGSHHMPDVFRDPERFDPDRFAAPREEDKQTPYSLVTFGGGSRVCIGQHFAHVETKALLVHVLRNYRLEPLPGQHPAHAGFINAFIPGGIQVRVQPVG
jgi:retinoid hydroxylase